MLVSNIMQVLKNLFGLNKKISADTIAFKDSSNNVDTLDNYLNSKTIYDSGSNNNGNWIRFTDGTMICYGSTQTTVNITSSWGALYETSSAVSLGDLPQPFIEKPEMFFMPWQPFFIERIYNDSSKTKWGSIYPCRASQASNWQINISKFAIGKWK